MKKLALCCLAALAAFASQVQAADSFYTDLPTFTATLKGQSYTETFNAGTGSGASSFSFSLNGFSYSVTSSNQDVYYGSGLIGADSPNVATIINFTSGNVLAVGGDFFNTNGANTFVSNAVTLTLSDGTSTTFTPPSASTFRGFTSSVPITRLTLAAPTDGTYSSLDNLVVGTTVPEPSTWATLGLGAMGAGVGAMRRRQVVT